MAAQCACPAAMSVPPPPLPPASGPAAAAAATRMSHPPAPASTSTTARRPPAARARPSRSPCSAAYWRTASMGAYAVTVDGGRPAMTHASISALRTKSPPAQGADNVALATAPPSWASANDFRWPRNMPASCTAESRTASPRTATSTSGSSSSPHTTRNGHVAMSDVVKGSLNRRPSNRLKS